MKKSLVLLLVVIMMVSVVLAGCTGAGNTSGGETETGTTPSESASTEEGVASTGQTITVMASQDWVKDPELELAQKFEAETGIAVDYQIIPADQYPNLLTTKLNSGESADIFMHQSGKFDIVSLLQIEKNALDLSDQEWVSRFDEAVKDQVTVDGKVYGVTIWDQSDSYAYIYNKKIFNDLGLKVPTTFEEFKAVCATLMENGVIPIYECVSDGWHHQLNFFDVSAMYDKANPNMVKELNENTTKFADNEVFKTMLEQMKEIVDAGYWGEYYMSNEYTGLADAMASGEYAMTVNMMGRLADIGAVGGEYTEEDFGIFAVPYLDNQVIAETPCGPSKFIYSGSQNGDAAKQYLEFLAQPENLQYIIDNTPSFNNLPFSGLQASYPAAMEEAIKTYKNGDSVVYQNAVIYVNPQWMEIGTDIAAYLMGDMTSEQVVQSIDQRRGDQASAAKDANWQ